MTRQIPDTVIYKGGEYVLAGLKGKGLLTPTDLNIVTKGLATACYRGYYCQYSCIDNFLFLTELSVFNETNQLPSLQGIVPNAILDMFARYQDLKIQCPFSGGFVIVKNLVAPNRTLPSPLEYNEVVEIIFEEGMLQGEIDYSSKVNMLRNILDEMWGKLANDPSELTDKLSKWISAPEKLPEEEAKKFKRYFDEKDRLEWSFVDGYEQQPPLWI